MSLTLEEARARAAQLSGVTYDLALDLTGAQEGGTFGVRATIGFASTGPATFLELTAATDVEVQLDGATVPAVYDGRRIRLTGLGGTHTVTVTARVPYVTDGDGMHFFTDPVDGATYVSAYLGIDVTQKVFPCFDQVDLKAPVTLSVLAEPEWTVLGNGLGTPPGTSDGASWTFTTTPPIPIDNVVVCAGPWHSVRWEHAGLPFAWHARASLAAELDRDADELRAITESCFDHYAAMFDEPYPFDTYEQAMVPGQNWGAQEMPGCIVYRDEYLPRGRMTDVDRTRRATVIAHEMAHMWFGNLVTMRWWEDTWLNESFADYMGYRVAAEAAGYPGSLLMHEMLRKPGAYDADVRRSTHPVAPLAEDVPDVDTAFGNFDAISYAKGNSVLRQLVTWLGDEDFLAGVNAHLTAHRFGNADLADFVDSLDSVTERDVRGWVEVWLRQAGHDTIRVTRDGDVPVLTREGVRPHRIRVSAYLLSGVEVASTYVDLGDEPVRLEPFAGYLVLPNSHGETFARLRLERYLLAPELLSSVTDDLARAVLWEHLFELVQSGELPGGGLVEVVERHLPKETAPALVDGVLLRFTSNVLPAHVGAKWVVRVRDMVAGACAAGLALTADEQVAASFTRGLAAHGRDAGLLRGWLAEDRAGLVTLTPALRWTLTARLAELGAADADEIEAERLRDGTYSGELGAARALAARPTPEAKAAAWSAMVDDERVSNRMFEALAGGLWSSEQVDLCAPYVARYFAEGPLVAERRGQAFSQVVGRAFPAVPLDDAQLDLLRTALAGHVPAVLRRHWEDRLDDRTPR